MSSHKRLGSAELLFLSAQQMNLSPSWIIPGGTFAVEIEDVERYINRSHSTINSHVAVSLARNKFLTRMILARHGLPNIPFLQPKTTHEAIEFLKIHRTIIAKPTEGSGSRDIHIVTTQLQLEQLAIKKYILEKYVSGQEMRYLVLNGSVIAVHRSEYGQSVEQDRYLERISIDEAKWDRLLVDYSLQIAAIIGLNFSAIDYLIDAHGIAHILEVNSTPGLKWFHAPSEGPAVDVATLFLQTFLVQSAPQFDNATTERAPNWYTQLA
jgi:glutathione synthase/RimK-type ligase-like ATP-grasp enzyme